MTNVVNISFCSHCGHPVTLRVPDGDSHERYVCDKCGAIHYVNPRIVVGTLSIWQEKILMCRRAIEPRRGWWTLPAGFMELGETTKQGAARETFEETGARVAVGELFSIVNVPHVQHVYHFYLAALNQASLAAGRESLEAGLLAEVEIPWDRIAFPAVAWTLRRFFDERAAGRIAAANFRVYTVDIDTPLQPFPSLCHDPVAGMAPSNLRVTSSRRGRK